MQHGAAPRGVPEGARRATESWEGRGWGWSVGAADTSGQSCGTAGPRAPGPLLLEAGGSGRTTGLWEKLDISLCQVFVWDVSSKAICKYFLTFFTICAGPRIVFYFFQYCHHFYLLKQRE